MSKQAIEAIIGRTVMDHDYRELFFADPNEALAGYELTKKERAALLSVDAETLDAFAERLGVHIKYDIASPHRHQRHPHLPPTARAVQGKLDR